MFYSLVLIITGIGFLDGTFGWTTDDQGSVHSRFETQRTPMNTEHSAETRRNKNEPELFDARAQNSVASPADRLPLGVKIIGSSGSTFAILNKIEKFHKIYNPRKQKMHIDSVSTPTFGRYMGLSQNRLNPKSNHLRPLVGKSDSTKKIEDMPVDVDEKKIRNYVYEVKSGFELPKITSTRTLPRNSEQERKDEASLGISSGEVINDWPGSEQGNKGDKDEATLNKIGRENLSDKKMLSGKFRINEKTDIEDNGNGGDDTKVGVDKNNVDTNCNNNDCNVSDNDINVNKINVSNYNQSSHNNNSNHKTFINRSYLINIFKDYISNKDRNKKVDDDNNNNNNDDIDNFYENNKKGVIDNNDDDIDNFYENNKKGVIDNNDDDDIDNFYENNKKGVIDNNDDDDIDNFYENNKKGVIDNNDDDIDNFYENNKKGVIDNNDDNYDNGHVDDAGNNNKDNSDKNRDNNYNKNNVIEIPHSTKVTLKHLFNNFAETEAKNIAKSPSKSKQNGVTKSEINVEDLFKLESLSGRFANKIQQREKDFWPLNAGNSLLPPIVSSTSPIALVTDDPTEQRTKRLSEESKKKSLSHDSETPKTLSESMIEKLLEFGIGNNEGQCPVLFKALLAQIALEKANRIIESKAKRSFKMAAQTTEQMSVSDRGSNTASKDRSRSTVSPNKSSLLNSRPVSTESLPVENTISSDNSQVSNDKNIMADKPMSTIISILKDQSTFTQAHTPSKFTSPEASRPDDEATTTVYNKVIDNLGSTESPIYPTSADSQRENESTMSFISVLLRHLRSQLPTGVMKNKNGSLIKTQTQTNIVRLIDFITSFMKLSYNIVDALMNNVDLKADVMNKNASKKRPVTESPVAGDIFTGLISDIFDPVANKAMKYNSTDRSYKPQSTESILLASEIIKEMNVTNLPLATGRNISTVQREFRTLISLARSDNKYMKEWTDSVLAFLSRQSHHFMESGIYERLSSFWPRSALTADSWTLRLAGYCAQIEFDEDLAVMESGPLFCPFKNPKCNNSAKYRDTTGICNNLENPLWGSANIPYRRQLNNAYGDGVSQPRTFGKGGGHLPNAKIISNTVFDNNDGKAKAEKINLLAVFFSQFVSHDITRFAMDIGDIGPVKVNCCLPDTRNRSECFPILTKEQNESNLNGSVRCLHFLRSMPTVPLGCQSHVREQINQVTSFIDASNVYGSSLQEMKDLRLFQCGLMKMALCGPESLPPTDRKGSSECGINAEERQFPCFFAGDPRVNENPALALVHVLWLREHNRIARRLGDINPHWDDTRLYEETRKIISALMQHVVYNELLPLVLGFEKAKEFQLLSGVGFFNDYESQTNPTLENGVATAAFRFGHGMVSNQFLFLAGCPSAHSKCSPNSILNGPSSDQERGFVTDPLIPPPMCPYMTQKNVSTMFENVDVFHQSETELESLLRGLLMQSAEVATDTMLSPAITERLFGHMDLMARNVQRARDHGLPSYNRWREWCGLPIARKFHTNKAGFVDHDMDVVKRFAKVYNQSEDVDLIIGGLTENPIEGGILGPLFVCMIGRQFRRLKFGDRFWYETEGQFTQDQLQEIRLMKMSHILLNNAGIESVPKFAFHKGSNDNPFITSVDQIQLELSLWKEDNERRTN